MTQNIKGLPQNLSRNHRELTPSEYPQCQQCGHRNRHVAPYHRPWYRRGDTQAFCQPSCSAVRVMLAAQSTKTTEEE